MTKFDIIRLYKVENVPDHIIEEVKELVNKMGISLRDACKGHDFNIVLSAFNRFHAAMIVAMISETGLNQAAKTEAIGLVKNIEHISGQTIWEEDEKAN